MVGMQISTDIRLNGVYVLLKTGFITDLSHDPGILLLGVYPMELNWHPKRYTLTVFVVIQFTVVKV